MVSNNTGHQHTPVHLDMTRGSCWICIDCRKILSKTADAVHMTDKDLEALSEFVLELRKKRNGKMVNGKWTPSKPKSSTES